MKYSRLLLLPFFLQLFVGCSPKEEKPAQLPMGIWRGTITQQGKELPFNFTLQSSESGRLEMVLHNDTERIVIDEVQRKGDSLFVTFNFFDTGLKLRIEENKLTGLYDKRYSDDHLLAFEAVPDDSRRFIRTGNEEGPDVSGRYSVIFTESDGKKYPAVAVFDQKNDKVTGTFLTETGDYRFLEGTTDSDSLKLSAFDGTHLFLFTARMDGDSLTGGEFWHGKNTYEKWSGIKNPEAELSDQYQLTYLKEGYDKISFSFPNLDGKTVSPDLPRYQDKVIILQILGTWCPNCMDETKFYTEWYKRNTDKPVEIIGLAYENKPEFDYAAARVRKMKEKLGVPYEILIAGTSDKAEASETLPMLNAIISFPTSIFLDKNGNVRKIHTGFSGPGTGREYEEWKTSFENLMETLLAEG